MASCPERHQKIAVGMEWTFRKRQGEGDLGNDFFLACAFQDDVAHLSFLFTFKNMMDLRRIILNVNVIIFSFPPSALLWQQKKI